MRIITCPVCTEPYPLYLFEFGIPFWCRCGAIIGRPTEDPASSLRAADPASEAHGRPRGAGGEPQDRRSAGTEEGGTSPSAIELSELEWLELRAELEAREREVFLPEFGWPYEYDTRFDRRPEQERWAKELQRRADRICYLITATNRPAREIEREQQELAERCRRYFPEVEEAYERIYERRFRKLWAEFRED